MFNILFSSRAIIPSLLGERQEARLLVDIFPGDTIGKVCQIREQKIIRLMPEISVNLHIHTQSSDGSGTHQDIANAAIETGLDAVIVTDHNILVDDQEGYYGKGDKRVLLLVGEEIHDQKRVPQKNHLLVFGVNKEMAGEAEDPNQLIKSVDRAGGLSFLAHPVDLAAPLFNQSDLSWVDWDISGYTGIELWNGFSEFKTRLTTKKQALFYAYQPKRVAQGPIPETLELWDRLLVEGQKVVAIGGSDAHAMNASMGPFKRVLFPYQFHFQAINTHLVIPQPLTGDLKKDKELVYGALRLGHAFVGYDLPYPTRGFQFKATGTELQGIMGDEIRLGEGVTLQIKLPLAVDCRLIKDGEIIKTWQNRDVCSYSTNSPGVFRVEAYISYKGQRRGWIYSNPIYIRE
jgi:hypothetical protein